MSLRDLLTAEPRIHEWRAGALSLAQPFAQSLTHGAYFLARAPSTPALWGSLRLALREARPLVILPPSSPAEEAILLRQLPAAPPPGAAVVLFTSGTTGDPKAVFHSESSLLASARQLARAFPGTGRVSGSLLPAWAMAGLVFHVLLPATRGGAHFFSAEPFLNWAPCAGSLLRDLDVDFVTLNPFLLEMLQRADLGEWHGTTVSLTAPLRMGQCAREIYGMTEAAGPILLDGKSLGAETRLSPEGELEIRGEQLFLGYASDGHFTPRPEWFGTGDLFALEGDGLYHRARLRDLIDTGGRKIPPRLLEESLEAMPEIAECLAFPVKLAGVERPGLLYVRRSDCTAQPKELAAAVERYLAEKISAEIRPRWWREVDALPRLKNGKPNRREAQARWGSLTTP